MFVNKFSESHGFVLCGNVLERYLHKCSLYEWQMDRIQYSKKVSNPIFGRRKSYL